jgi:DNA-binding XRE family transcriptional regulator
MVMNIVAKWRLEKKISKAHLARQIRVCRAYVTRLEKGELQPSGDVMFRIAGYFKCRVEDVFQRVPNGGRPEIVSSQFFTREAANPLCNSPATLPVCPAGMESPKDKSLANPTAKAVASPIAQSSQKKTK